MRRAGILVAAATGLVAWSWSSDAPARDAAMTRGPVELRSIGPLTFSPAGVLFVGDSYGASVYAIDLEEGAVHHGPAINVDGIDGRVASMLGTARDQIRIHDIAVSPVSREVYLSVSRGGSERDAGIRNHTTAGATPHLIRVDLEGELHEVSLDDVRFARAELEDVRPEEIDDRGNDRRAWNILEMSFAGDVLYVSGMSNEEWSSKLRRLPYPFEREASSNALKIFHTAHGRYETYAPARVFVPYEADGTTRVFAGFSCTPLVDFSVAEMDERERVEGRTIAELGAGNHVLDMISVRHRDETYFFLANHRHPFMRLARSDFHGAEAMTRPSGAGGIDRSPLRLEGVTRLANDGDQWVVMLQAHGAEVSLRSVAVDELID